jgi:hypothetical protein
MNDQETAEIAHHHALCLEDPQHWFDVVAPQIDAKAHPQQLLKRNATNALAHAAQWYAINGMRVFPITPLKKNPPLVKWGSQASNDVEQVKAWWAKWPNANIGLVCGEIFDVIDLDTIEAMQQFNAMPPSVQPSILGSVKTPHGRHIFITPEPSLSVEVGMLDGWDYRGAGGYVVAPPSRNAEGKTYEWLKPPTWVQR